MLACASMTIRSETVGFAPAPPKRTMVPCGRGGLGGAESHARLALQSLRPHHGPMRSLVAPGLAVTLTALVAAACSSTAGTAGSGPEADAGPNADAAIPLTYRARIAPMLEQRCNGCHHEGGSAPFALTTYAAVSDIARTLEASMRERRMPPWLPDSDCHALEGSRRMPRAEIETFAEWVAAGKPEGTGEVVRAGSSGTSAPFVPTVTAAIPAQYISPEIDDDYRCFVLPPEFPSTVYATGLDVKPGSARVHHALVYALSGEALAKAQAKDGTDGKPGYTCFSGVVPGVDPTQARNVSSALPPLLGGWVPGSVPQVRPEGVGQRIPRGSRLVVQMHYSAIGGRPAPDSTEIQLRTTATPPAYLVDVKPVVNLDIPTPAGEVKTHTIQFTYYNTKPKNIFGLTPHMHLLGTSIRSDLVSASGEESCVVNLPHWDFHWQQAYSTPENDPIVVRNGDAIRLTCTYDNTAANQPTIDGVKGPPADVKWGEGTRDEMCLLYTASVAPFTPEHEKTCDAARACASTKPYSTETLFGCESQEAECTLCEVSALVACTAQACGAKLLPMQACLRSCAVSAALMGSNMGMCLKARCGAEYEAAKPCVDAQWGSASCTTELAKCGL